MTIEQQTMADPQEALRKRDLAGLRDSLKNWQPPDRPNLLRGASEEDAVVLFLILPRKVAAETFAYLTSQQQERLLKAMASEDVSWRCSTRWCLMTVRHPRGAARLKATRQLLAL